jgi:hypothetical protein
MTKWDRDSDSLQGIPALHTDQFCFPAAPMTYMQGSAMKLDRKREVNAWSTLTELYAPVVRVKPHAAE